MKNEDLTPITVGVLTVSDRSSRGEREDKSGKVALEIVSKLGAKLVRYEIIPDEIPAIAEGILMCADGLGLDLVLTTGGTGFSPRDRTPEATAAILEKEAPGLSELMRLESYKRNPKAMLSRGISGIRGKTLIINLPGSPRAVRECMEAILPVLPHAISVMRGEVTDCGESHGES